MSKIALLPVAIIGAGPYGLSLSAHLSAAHIAQRIFGSSDGAGNLSGWEQSSSDVLGVDDAFTFATFCAAHGLLDAPAERGSAAVCAAYCRAFRDRFVPQLEDAAVVQVERIAAGFALRLATGERVRAAHLVIAAGDSAAADGLKGLDAELRLELHADSARPSVWRGFERHAGNLHLIGPGTAGRSRESPRAAARRLTRRFEALGLDRVGEEALTDAPRVAFLALAHDVRADQIVAQISRGGAVCALIGTRESFPFGSIAASERLDLPPFGGPIVASFFARRQLEKLARDWAPDVLVPLDDPAERLLRRMVEGGRVSRGLRALIRTSLNPTSQAGLLKVLVGDAMPDFVLERPPSDSRAA